MVLIHTPQPFGQLLYLRGALFGKILLNIKVLGEHYFTSTFLPSMMYIPGAEISLSLRPLRSKISFLSALCSFIF